MSDFEHGTYGGAQRHQRLGETPCPACLRARAEYQRAYRLKRGETTHVMVPLPLFRVVLDRTSEPLATQLRSLLPDGAA